MRLRRPCGYFLSALFGVALSVSTVGSANLRDFHPLHCRSQQSNVAPNPAFYSEYENNRTTIGIVHCPILGDDHISPGDASALSVTVYDATPNDYVVSRACVGFLVGGGDGGACGAAAFTGAASVGYTSISPDISAWSGASQQDYAYLIVELPPKETVYGPSAINGYRISN